MSLTKKIKWFSVTFLLTISTCSLADEIVQLGWGGNYDELSNQKKYLINELPPFKGCCGNHSASW